MPPDTVTKVIDGDTIVLKRIGKVRYIGVNAPELHHPRKGREPYGVEAYLANQKLVAGREVRLEYDVQRRDKYGRTLAYVYSGAVFVNACLVETGFAQVMTVPPNVKYAALFRRLQQTARAKGAGLWGDSQQPRPDGKSGGPYIASRKSDKYHLPSCKWAKRIKDSNRIRFNSVREAENAGYKACEVCGPR